MRSRLWFLFVLTTVLFILSFYSESVIGQPFLPFLEGKISGTVICASTGQPVENSIVTAGIGSSVNQTAPTNGTG